MSFRSKRMTTRGFTLIELLVTISVAAVLAMLLFPALAHARTRSKQTVCLNHLRQWSLGLTLYANENQDRLARESYLPDGVTLNTWVEAAHPLGADVWYNAVAVTVGQLPARHFAPKATRADFYRRSQIFHCPNAKFPNRASLNTIAFFSLAMNSKLIMRSRENVKLTEVRQPTLTVAFLENRLADEPMIHPLQPTLELGQPSAYASRFVTRHRDVGGLSFVDGHVASHRAAEVVRDGLALFPQTQLVWTLDPAANPNDE